MKNLKIKTTTGITLIELTIVLAIAGILLSLAVPSFSQMLSHNQKITQLHVLFSHHQLARSEAIKTNTRVLLCKSSTGLNCTTNAQWSDGWIVFADKDNSNSVSEDELIIFTQQALPHNLTLNYRGFGSHNYIRYYPDGHSSTNGTFILCSQTGDSQGKGLIISRTGRPRTSSKNSRGDALNCG